MDLSSQKLIDKWIENNNENSPLILYNFEKDLKIPDNVKKIKIRYRLETLTLNLPKSIEILELNYIFKSIDKLILKNSDNLKELKIKQCNFKTLKNLPDNIEKLHLEGRFIYNNVNKQDIDIINLPSKLKKLSINGFNFLNFNFLKEGIISNSIKSLKINDTNLDGCSFIKNLTNLKTLDLSKNLIWYVETLPENLKEVNLSNNQIIEISKYSNKIKDLDVSHNNLTYYDNLPLSVENLKINSNHINFLKLNLPNLESLECLRCSITKILYLPENLKDLDISENKLSNDENIPLNLKKLNISNNSFKNIELSKYINLENLNISNNLFLNVDLKTCLNLKNFKCSGNKITKIKTLPENLEDIDFSDNLIQNIKSLPSNLKKILISKNILTKLPKLPENLKFFNCSNNLIKKLPDIPEDLETLFCGSNILTVIPKLNEKIVYLNCENNQISELPEAPKSLSFLNCSGNLFNYVPKLSNENPEIIFENNPIYEELSPLIRSIKLPLSTRIFKNYEVNTIILPKGTLLFRGFGNEKKIIQDFIGFNPDGKKYNYLFTNHNTFFYPYPYVSENVVFSGVICMYVLTEDITIISELYPSRNKRSDMDLDLYTTRCSKINFTKNLKGLSYDPCLTEDFITENLDIKGQICLFDIDLRAQNEINIEKIPFLKYRRNFMDSANVVGIPELILHPLKERNLKPIKMKKQEATYEWLSNNIDKYIYEPLYIEKYEGDKKKIGIIDELLKPEGATISGKNFHMTIDPMTSFYIIYELCSEEVQKRCIPVEEINKLDFL